MAYGDASYTLLSGGSATGLGVIWRGGRGTFVVPTGTFGGATVRLEWSPDDGTTWLPVDSQGATYVTLTSTGAGYFELPECKVRAAVIGGSPSNLTALVKGY